MVNNELGMMRNEFIVSYFNVLFQNLTGGTEKSDKPVRKACLLAEIRARDLTNINYSTAAFGEELA